MNNVCLLGRISHELELKSTTSGNSICNFNLAVSKTNSEGANFIPCRAWNKTAENLVRYKKKGDLIVLVGSVETHDYEDDAGQKRKYVYVNCNRIQYVSGGNSQVSNSESTQTEELANEIFGSDNVNVQEENDIISFDDLPFDMGA